MNDGLTNLLKLRAVLLKYIRNYAHAVHVLADIWNSVVIIIEFGEHYLSVWESRRSLYN